MPCQALDKAYDVTNFVGNLRARDVTPHIAINGAISKLGNRAYDSNALHEALAARGAFANIRLMPNRVKSFSLDRELYKTRDFVERFFNQLQHFQSIATRYDKRDDDFMASVQLASLRIWLRSYELVT